MRKLILALTLIALVSSWTDIDPCCAADSTEYILSGVCTACGAACETCALNGSSDTDSCVCKSDENCTTCADATSCTACETGYYVADNGCTACLTSCTACDDGTTCTACASGTIYYSADSGTTNSCSTPTNAIDNCEDYSSTTSPESDLASSTILCSDCEGNWSVSSAGACECTATASTGYFLTTSDCSFTACDDSCSACTAATTCSGCNSSYFLDGTTCTACEDNCYACDDATTCTQCNAYYFGTADCAACSDECYACDDAATCTGCNSGFFILDLACSACSDGCSACDDATTCTACSTGFFLDGTSCTACGDDCDTCTSATVCTVCSSGHGLNSGACEDCASEGCSDCDGPCEGQCTDCVTGYDFFEGSCTAESGAGGGDSTSDDGIRLAFVGAALLVSFAMSYIF